MYNINIMVDNLAELNKHLAHSANPEKLPVAPLHDLLDTYSDLVSFDRKLQSYTLSKCAYERNMETCILEYLYFNTRTRSIL